jgi:hypothetical protein
MEARAIKRAGAAMASIAVLLPALAGCGSSGDNSSSAAQQSGTNTFPQSSEPANLNPADFTTNIDNAYFPLPVGARWEIRVTDQEGLLQHEVITVLDQTRKMADGVTARVVHDVVTEGGKLAEVTDDWYAQDKDGNVWYFGEDTKELEGGKVTSTEGSWTTGVDGAQAGIFMPADPQVGTSGLQEFLAGHAEDRFVVLLTDSKVKVPAGSFTGALLTAEWTRLEPDVLTEKSYVRGLGEVREVDVAGGDEKLELVKAVGT